MSFSIVTFILLRGVFIGEICFIFLLWKLYCLIVLSGWFVEFILYILNSLLNVDFLGWDFWVLNLFRLFGSIWKFFVVLRRFLYVMFWWISFFFLIWLIRKWGDNVGSWICLSSLVKKDCFFCIFCLVYVMRVL